MNQRHAALRRALATLATVALVTMAATADGEAAKRAKWEWTDSFPIGDCSALVTSTDDGAINPYWILEIGRVWELSNEECFDAGECDELEEVTITVLPDTEMVDGVLTRVIEEKEYVDGSLEEVSRNFYVECLGTGDVFYFGEDVEDGNGDPLPDGWRSGVNGASAGMAFAGGSFLIGARYYQEIAPGIALDRAEHAESGLDVMVPAGNFSDCVLVLDDNGIENPKSKRKHLEEKVYCPGIGFVTDEDMELVNLIEP